MLGNTPVETYLNSQGPDVPKGHAEILLHSEDIIFKAASRLSVAAQDRGVSIDLRVDPAQRNRLLPQSSAAGDGRYRIDIPASCMHHVLVCTKDLSESLQPLSVKKLHASALLLIFFHEAAHITWGHFESRAHTSQEYRADETSADFRAGVLFGQLLHQDKNFSKIIGMTRLDDRLEYGVAAAFVVGDYLRRVSDPKNARYHAPATRVHLMMAGLLHSNTVLRVLPISRSRAIITKIEKRVRDCESTALRALLLGNRSDEQSLISETAPIMDNRVPELLNAGRVAAKIRDALGRFTTRPKRRGAKLPKRV